MVAVWYCCPAGYLCGECQDDKGVSVLLNKCVSCEYVNILIIIALGESSIRVYYYKWLH